MKEQGNSNAGIAVGGELKNSFLNTAAATSSVLFMSRGGAVLLAATGSNCVCDRAARQLLACWLRAKPSTCSLSLRRGHLGLLQCVSSHPLTAGGVGILLWGAKGSKDVKLPITVGPQTKGEAGPRGRL